MISKEDLILATLSADCYNIDGTKLQKAIFLIQQDELLLVEGKFEFVPGTYGPLNYGEISNILEDLNISEDVVAMWRPYDPIKARYYCVTRAGSSKGIDILFKLPYDTYLYIAEIVDYVQTNDFETITNGLREQYPEMFVK